MFSQLEAELQFTISRALAHTIKSRVEVNYIVNIFYQYRKHDGIQFEMRRGTLQLVLQTMEY